MSRIVSYKRPKDLKSTLHKFFKYLGHYKKYLVLITILIFISSIANIIGTYSIKWVVDLALEKQQDKMYLTILLVAILYLLGTICALLASQFTIIVSQKVVYDLRHDLYKKVSKLDISFFDKHEFGDIMARFTSDIETVSEALNNSFSGIIENLIQLVGTIIAMFLLSYQLSFIVMLFYVVMIIYLFFSGKKSKYYFKKQQEHLGKLSGFTEEAIRGIKVIKVFNHEKESLEQFDKESSYLQKVSKKALFYSNSMVPMVMAISYINYSIVTIVGGILSLKGIIPVSVLAPYLVFVRQSALPINRFTAQANIILNALASLERIFNIINLEDEKDNGTIEIVRKDIDKKSHFYFNINDELKEIKGDVRFNHVYFSYDNKKMILNDISLYAKPGQKIAFVGSTGAGKTTITNLINRFYDINKGSITIDGIDIKDIKKDSLRSALGMVLQDTHLFSGTIEENIRFGKLNASFEEVVEACKLANADSFIRRLPNSYQTILTSDGANLSMGQRQLLAIARASISDPKILILDEATASIDTYTEKMIQDGMDKLMQNRTVFVIAHRLSTVKNADAIIVLEQGKIIERGNHEDLLKQKGRYYKLYTGKSELS